MYSQLYTKKAQLILNELEYVLYEMDRESVLKFINMINGAEKIFFVGVGRVKLSAAAFVKRLSHLGYDVCMVGDLTEKAITDRDLLVVCSGSGETLFPKAIAEKAKNFGARIAYLGRNINSSAAMLSDLQVIFPIGPECDEFGLKSEQPMTSLFEQSLMIFGDIVTLMILDMVGIPKDFIEQRHANLE